VEDDRHHDGLATRDRRADYLIVQVPIVEIEMDQWRETKIITS
jgi:hypothetical protein